MYPYTKQLFRKIPLGRACPSFAAALLGLITATASFAQTVRPTIDEIDAWVEAGLERWDVPGLTLAIIDNGEIYLSKGYGVRELGKSSKVDENTLFSIGSCSKAFGAASLAALVEEGALTWDDRVIDHLPWFRLHDPWTTNEIRVRDIITHRVGTGSTQQLRPLVHNRRDYLSRLPYNTPDHQFRDRYGYTNDMLILTGQLVETVSGVDWDSFARDRLWAPLGMNTTTARMAPANTSPNHAEPHAFRERRYVGGYNTPGPPLEPVPWQYAENVMVPSGGVISSASEMAEWMKFHLGTHPSPPLTKASVELMHTPHTVIQRPTSWMTFEEPGAYAMGWATGRFDNVTTVGHAGAALGFNCSIAMVPQKRFGIFTTANRNSELPYVLTKWAVTQFFGGPEARARDWHAEHERNVRATNRRAGEAEKTRTETRLSQGPSLPLDAYVGRFQNNFAGTLEIQLTQDPTEFQLRPAEGRAGRWDATPGVHEREEPNMDRTSSDGRDKPFLVAQLDGREGPIQLPLDPWHLDQFDAWYGDIRIGVSFTINDLAKVTGVTLDYYGDFERIR